MTSKEIREAKMGIMDFLAGLDVPAEVKRMMVGEICREMDAQAMAEINTEVRAANGNVADKETRVDEETGTDKDEKKPERNQAG